MRRLSGVVGTIVFLGACGTSAPEPPPSEAPSPEAAPPSSDPPASPALATANDEVVTLSSTLGCPREGADCDIIAALDTGQPITVAADRALSYVGVLSCPGAPGPLVVGRLRLAAGSDGALRAHLDAELDSVSDVAAARADWETPLAAIEAGTPPPDLSSRFDWAYAPRVQVTEFWRTAEAHGGWYRDSEGRFTLAAPTDRAVLVVGTVGTLDCVGRLVRVSDAAVVATPPLGCSPNRVSMDEERGLVLLGFSCFEPSGDPSGQGEDVTRVVDCTSAECACIEAGATRSTFERPDRRLTRTDMVRWTADPCDWTIGF